MFIVVMCLFQCASLFSMFNNTAVVSGDIPSHFVVDILKNSVRVLEHADVGAYQGKQKNRPHKKTKQEKFDSKVTNIRNDMIRRWSKTVYDNFEILAVTFNPLSSLKFISADGAQDKLAQLSEVPYVNHLTKEVIVELVKRDHYFATLIGALVQKHSTLNNLSKRIDDLIGNNALFPKLLGSVNEVARDTLYNDFYNTLLGNYSCQEIMSSDGINRLDYLFTAHYQCKMQLIFFRHILVTMKIYLQPLEVDPGEYIQESPLFLSESGYLLKGKNNRGERIIWNLRTGKKENDSKNGITRWQYDACSSDKTCDFVNLSIDWQRYLFPNLKSYKETNRFFMVRPTIESYFYQFAFLESLRSKPELLTLLSSKNWKHMHGFVRNNLRSMIEHHIHQMEIEEVEGEF